MHSLNGFGQWAAKNNLSRKTDMLMELPWPVWSGWGCELPGGQDVKSPITCKVNSKCKWSLSFPETLCMAGKEQHCPKTSFMETLGKERIALHWHPSVLGSKLSSPNQKHSVVSPSLSLTLNLLCLFRPKILLANVPPAPYTGCPFHCSLQKTCSCFRPLIRLHLSCPLFSSFTPSSKVSFLTHCESF